MCFSCCPFDIWSWMILPLLLLSKSYLHKYSQTYFNRSRSWRCHRSLWYTKSYFLLSVNLFQREYLMFALMHGYSPPTYLLSWVLLVSEYHEMRVLVCKIFCWKKPEMPQLKPHKFKSVTIRGSRWPKGKKL